MKVKLITVCTDPNDYGLQQLKRSLDQFNWPHEILVAPVWKGFGTKLLTVASYLQNNNIDAIFFCDAYDCVVLGTMEEALDKLEANYGLDKMVCSSERGCWPLPDYNQYYKNQFEHRYNFLNSGLYYTPKDVYLKLIETKIPEFSDDDQLYLTEHFLFNENSNIVLDNGCDIFQSYSFIEEGDYSYYLNRITNLKTETSPVIIHGNGRQDLTQIYNLI